ncbi:helicase associated domain-containing protein [Streptomyces sp. NPDC008001]|uniref:helicase associated domain-containing protein n=1 Tax=Streptomyces sp. NPDC008001 TaxID=3364804 RepID=UPI0036EC90ED
MRADLKEFREEHGHLRVPQRYVTKGRKLGQQVATRRQTFAELPTERAGDSSTWGSSPTPESTAGTST